MGPITPVKFTTPDGVERNLVWRLGSERLIVDWLGCTLGQAIIKYDLAAVPELLYASMYDDEMDPPPDLTRKKLAAMLDPDLRVEYMATWMSAISKGRNSKNEIEVLLKKAMESQMSMTDIGSMLGVSLGSASTSASENSIPSPNGNSNLSASDTEKSETSAEAALDSSRPHSLMSTAQKKRPH